MLIEIRCFSCGKPLGHLYAKYLKEVEKGKNPKEVLDKLGVERYCCRALFLGNIELLDTVARFKRS